MNFKYLEIAEEQRIAIVTIQRPNKLNALNVELMEELKDYFSRFANLREYSIRGIILVGAGGRAFVAGADIQEMSEMNEHQGEAFGALGQSVTTAIESAAIPVIACVDGFAFGGGCELAMSCDFIYATNNAKFGQPEVNLGLIPGFGGCVRLGRYIGPGLAKELIYTGRVIDAVEAKLMGLANEIYSDRNSMIAAAKDCLKLISEKSPTAVSICKDIINDIQGANTEAALFKEKIGFRKAFTTKDKVEGVNAFLQKRRAVFPGH